MSNEQNNTVLTEIPDTEENDDMYKHLSCDHIQPISKWEKFKSVLAFFWVDRKPAIITTIAVALSVIIFLTISNTYIISELLSSYFDSKQLVSTMIQLTTFLAILSIWYRTIRKEWRQKLNKFLSVTFVHEKTIRIRCRYAKLSSEADARGMAQSFAKTLNCQYLDIAPSMQEITQAIEVDKNKSVDGDCCYLINSGEPFLHYDVVIHLIEDINTLCENNEDKKIELENNEYVQWDYPFDINSKKIIGEK